MTSPGFSVFCSRVAAFVYVCICGYILEQLHADQVFVSKFVGVVSIKRVQATLPGVGRTGNVLCVTQSLGYCFCHSDSWALHPH